MPSLTRAEAQRRADLLAVTAMEVDLDLDQGPEHFTSVTTIHFTCDEPGAGTFVDVRPVHLHESRLGDTVLDVTTLADGRLPLTGLARDNVLTIRATMAYSHDGQGLHRTTDPADAEDYVYGHLFLDAAPTVFACFDQPDLKAPYDVTVTAPPAWTVLGNGAANREAPGRWRLATTRPLATYFVTVCAGPWASVTEEHDGIPLGIHARASRAADLHEHAPQMLEVTRQCFDAYHDLFGIRYPFGDYHQVFVPEFNAGAMENPGCVTFRDELIPRGAATRTEIMSRSLTIAHEMAHMWLGDLVTMRWWDDLWLNESFAEHMAYRIASTATEFTDAWVDFGIVRKMWGYAAERAPSTHPVAGSPAPDALTALGNFDGISYAKGAAVLRQLIAHIGDPAFVAGVTAYLHEHAYGNGELSEFLAAMEQAHGRSLRAWSAAWLETAGVDTIALSRTGFLSREQPPEGPERSHTLDIAGYTGGRLDLRMGIRLDQGRLELPGLEGVASTLLIPNASDLTWATVRLDPDTLAALPDALAEVPDALARSVAWSAVLTGVHTGQVDPRRALDVFAGAWTGERDDTILGRVATLVTDVVVPLFLPADEQRAALARVAAAADRRLTAAEPGSSVALVAARTLSRTTADIGRQRAWLEGDHTSSAPVEGLPGGLLADRDLRWLILTNLASRGEVSPGELTHEEEVDGTLTGRLAALTAHAAQPDADAKAWAWGRLVSGGCSNHECLALARGFWRAPSLDVVRPYVARYPDLVDAVSAHLGEDAAARVLTAAYPLRVVEEATDEMAHRLLERDDLTAAARRAVVDAQHQMGEALRSREEYPAR